MSTRCGIGIKKDGVITGIYCHHDGYLSNAGLTLLNYYKSVNKIEGLINLGNLSGLGANLYSPKVKFPTVDNMHECHVISCWPAVSFCFPYGGERERAFEVKSVKKFIEGIDGEYYYLFDVDSNKWFVVEPDCKSDIIKYYDLKKLVSNKNYFLSYRSFRDSYWIYTKEDEINYAKYALEEWDRIQNVKPWYVDICDEMILSICNDWLNDARSRSENGTNICMEVGISTTKDLGRHFVIFESLKEGNKKRKVLHRSKNPNDLTLIICNQLGISPYARPFF